MGIHLTQSSNIMKSLLVCLAIVALTAFAQEEPARGPAAFAPLFYGGYPFYGHADYPFVHHPLVKKKIAKIECLNNFGQAVPCAGDDYMDLVRPQDVLFSPGLGGSRLPINNVGDAPEKLTGTTSVVDAFVCQNHQGSAVPCSYPNSGGAIHAVGKRSAEPEPEAKADTFWGYYGGWAGYRRYYGYGRPYYGRYYGRYYG